MLGPKRGGKVTLLQPSMDAPMRENGVVKLASGDAYTRSKKGSVVVATPNAGPRR
jgi:hypothetical protein